MMASRICRSIATMMATLSIFAKAYVSIQPWRHQHQHQHQHHRHAITQLFFSIGSFSTNRWVNMSTPLNQDTLLQPLATTAAATTVLPSSSRVAETTLQHQIEDFDPFHLEEITRTGVVASKVAWQDALMSTPRDAASTLLSTAAPPQKDGPKLGLWAARSLLLLVAMLWGTNFASVKYLETICLDPPCVQSLPSESALARFGIAAAVSVPLLLSQPWPVIAGGLECGIWITMGYITQAMALPYIASGKCAFICSLTVVLVPVMSAIFFGKPIKPVHFVSAAIALAGVGVLEGMLPLDQLLGLPVDSTVAAVAAEAAVALESSSLTESGPDIILNSIATTLGVGKGDVLALGQPLGFGLAFMRIEHYVEKFKDVPNRIITISAAQCVAVGMLALAWVLYDFQGQIPDFGYMLEPHHLVAILWTGIMTTVVAIYLEGVALQSCSASEAALTFSSEPVWASMFGAWLLRERLNTNTYVGGAVILVACILGALADVKNLSGGEEEEEKKTDIDSLDAQLLVDPTLEEAT